MSCAPIRTLAGGATTAPWPATEASPAAGRSASAPWLVAQAQTPVPAVARRHDRRPRSGSHGAGPAGAGSGRAPPRARPPAGECPRPRAAVRPLPGSRPRGPGRRRVAAHAGGGQGFGLPEQRSLVVRGPRHGRRELGQGVLEMPQPHVHTAQARVRKGARRGDLGREPVSRQGLLEGTPQHRHMAGPKRFLVALIELVRHGAHDDFRTHRCRKYLRWTESALGPTPGVRSGSRSIA